MFRITLAATGLSRVNNPTVQRDIEEEFTHRPWHQNVRCYWDEGKLILEAENDSDSDGLALMDEFSDAISACAQDVGDGGLEVVSVSDL